ncbi:MAG: response regulator [Rhodocyclaceae bacterium]|nr:response regulator [Rhodocyclaceae bacterium]
MAYPASYSDKRLLIIDDMPDMRSTLRSQVASLAIEKVGVAGNIRDAIEQLKKTRFDIILCDYYLGGGTDGQQFLEFLRSTNMISRATLFIMVTAETGYEGVITAAECLPDDYLIKPFTADTLHSRFERLLEKKARLAAIDKLQDQGRWQEMIVACDEIIAAKDKYLIDAMRIKGNALVMSGQFEAARDFYQQALALRPMPWAKLGLARALRSIGAGDEAKALLADIIADSPSFLSAYDMLGRIHLEEGRSEEALKVLDSACNVSPNSLARHRSIAGIAEDAADFGRVEQALSIVVRKTRNSPLRNSADYAKLGNALAEIGETGKAVAVLEEAKTSFKESGDVRLLAAVEAVTQQKAGNPALAQQALERALAGGTAALPAATALAIAKACLANDRQDEALALFKDVIQNNPEATAVHGRVSSILKQHGSEELSRQLIESSIKEIIRLNNSAVEKAKAGEFAVASQMLTAAAARLPDNLQIVANAAYCLLLDVFMNGLDAAKLREAQLLQQAVVGKNSRHPKLADISDLMVKIQAKYRPAASA